MCTRHLADNFAHLADTIEADGVLDAARAIAYLQRARQALVYPGCPPQLVQVHAEQITAFLARRAIGADRTVEALAALDAALELLPIDGRRAARAVLAAGAARLERQ
jgi:hypothetical protein